MVDAPRVVELTEYTPQYLPRDFMTKNEGWALWQIYNAQVAVEFPTPKTDDRWELTAQGWVGSLPLSDTFHIVLKPKVALANLFGMLEYAYRLKSFRFLDGLMDCKSLTDFYERLANVLAHRVLDRGRKGYYRAYLPRSEALPFIRGRLNVLRIIQRPWDIRLSCHYEEHTPDIEENQILTWTLSCIARSGMCTERVLPTVRRAYRALQGMTTLLPVAPGVCVARLYNRLNEDYHPMHALCRFFLEHSGPAHEMGDRAMLPFLVNMERLYELFVAEWLKIHLPETIELVSQERFSIGKEGSLHFDIDIVLQDVTTGETLCVIDTKYKAPDQPASDDVAQVVAYAEAKDCKDAVLVYPIDLCQPLDESIGNIRVRSLAFMLKEDLENAGEKFVAELFEEEEL